MRLNKTGIAFFITLMFVAGIIVPLVSAVENISIGENPTSGVTTPPMISFEGLSIPVSATYNATDLNIPSSIKKYELLTFDIPKMREKLAKNETITVRIKAEPYRMIVHDSTGKAEGLDPTIRSYQGSLENVQNSEVDFTSSDQVIVGRILINGVNYFIDVSHKKENEKVINYIYSSLDIIDEGIPIKIDEDYFKRSNLSTLTNETPTIQSPSTKQNVPIPIIITLGSLGLIVLMIPNRR
jgi:hypothetical protein